MERRSPLRALAVLSLSLMALPVVAEDSLSKVTSGFQAEASRGQLGAARPVRVDLPAGEPLTGQAEVQALGDARCRSIIELVYNRPYERRGVLITGLKRRSVQDGSCARLAAFMTEQAQREAAAIEAQIHAAASYVAAPAKAQPVVARRPESILQPVPPPTRLAPPATAQSSASYQLTVLRRAVIRDTPSFNGSRRAMLPAGEIRLGRLVPGREGWYEILDLASGPAYIHESVVAQGPPAGRA